MIPFIRRIPLPMSALALGLAGLGNLLVGYSPAVRLACGIASAILALLVLVRVAGDFSGVRDELSNPGTLAVLPTLFMALMLLAVYLKPYAAGPAKALWLVALAIQMATVALFALRFVWRLKIEQVLPSWFIVFVGFVVASVTSPAFEMQPVGRALLYAGAIGYLFSLPLVLLRMRGKPLPAPARPTTVIFAAPVALCLAGYLSVTEAKEAGVIWVMLAAALASLLFALVNVPSVLRAGFSPAYAALTFPLVITAIAVKQSAAFLGVIPGYAVIAMDVLATAMVAFVLVRYVLFLAMRPAPTPKVVPEAA